DTLTIDGSRGLVYSGEVEVVAAATVPEFETLMEWADAERRMGIRTNADTPRAVRTARSYGAEGVGLCRTEHMFFSDERLSAVRCMVLAPNAEAREEWLAKLEPMQRGDFQKIFEAMDGLPVTIRLLDWPLHEFLPKEPSEVREVAEALGEPVEAVDARARAMHEINPMLGHRGVRLGLTLPEVYEMQVRAIGEAAAEAQRAGRTVNLEIMIPVVAMASELGAMAAVVRATMDQVLSAHEATLNYLIGTMIELPRACLTADALAASAEFFSFGTNDLTQTTFGVSRDDAGRFLPAYLADPRGLLTVDPFVRLDESGVGRLIELAVEGGRRTRPELKLGICGEHGGDPGSIDFAERAGLDYVSCSPPRLPVARLAAAQAAVRKRREE
ncbi:MAG: putative PEP-binding protein, partial [Myxococcota bacterium]